MTSCATSGAATSRGTRCDPGVSIPPDALGAPLDVRPLLAPLREALVEVMTDRNDPAWEAATMTGWTVADTIAHLLGDDLGRLARTRDDHPAPGPEVDETFEQYIDRLNHEWVIAARRLSPRLLVELLGHTGKQVRALWAGHELDEPAEAVSWAGVDPAPLWLDIARDYTEYWVHQAQVREALDEPLLDDPKFLEPVVSTYLRALPHALRELSPTEGEATADHRGHRPHPGGLAPAGRPRRLALRRGRRSCRHRRALGGRHRVAARVPHDRPADGPSPRARRRRRRRRGGRLRAAGGHPPGVRNGASIRSVASRSRARAWSSRACGSGSARRVPCE